jgi:dCMP deaminase
LTPRQRSDWRTVWLNVARSVSERSSCSRSQVGAVLVWRNEQIFVGYNGPKSGQPNCDIGGCPRGKLTLDEMPSGARFDGPVICTAIHAEINALIKFKIFLRAMNKQGMTGLLKECVLYSTRKPCEMCMAELDKWLKLEQIVWAD